MALLALGPAGCETVVAPSSGGRVGVEPARWAWPECSVSPVAVGCGRGAEEDGGGGGSGTVAAVVAAAGEKCVSTCAAACCAACWAMSCMLVGRPRLA